VDNLDLTGIPAVVLIAVIGGVVEVAKRAGLASRWAGILSLVVGMVFGLLAALAGSVLVAAIVQGAILGLTATGVYAATAAAAGPALAKRNNRRNGRPTSDD